MFELQFQITLAEVRTVARAWPLSWRIAWSWTWYGLLILCGLPGTLLFMALDNWPAVAGGWISIGLLAAVVCFRNWRIKRFALLGVKERLYHTTFRANPEGFHVENQRGWSYCSWQSIERVVVQRRYIYLVTIGQMVYIVPKRVFNSPAQAEEFAHAAAAYQRQAHGAGAAVPALPPLPDMGDGWEITYRTSPAEFLAAQFEGVQTKDLLPEQRQNMWSLALTGLGMLVLSGSGDVTLQALCGSVAQLCFTLVLFKLTRNLQRRPYLALSTRRSELEKTLAISVDGVSLATAVDRRFGRWLEFSGIERNEQFIVFYQNNNTYLAVLIPKRAFANPSVADQFAEQAKEWWRRAQPFAELPPPVETGNPYQSPAAR